jgi:hypothetical protein
MLLGLQMTPVVVTNAFCLKAEWSACARACVCVHVCARVGDGDKAALDML